MMEWTPGPKSLQGFTLLELVVVIMMLGILAGIAVPNLQHALWKAHAASIVSDSHTVRLAAAEFMSDHGRYPRAGGWGSVPSELVDYLPDGFDFEYEGVVYLWSSATYSNDNNSWGTRHLGLFVVNYVRRPPLRRAMSAHRGTYGLQAGSLFIFIFPG